MYGVQHLYHELCNVEPDVLPGSLIKLSKSRIITMLDILKNSVMPKNDAGEVCCIVCGKDHLRQVSAKEMGGKSVLREFIDQNKYRFKFI